MHYHLTTRTQQERRKNIYENNMERKERLIFQILLKEESILYCL